MIRLRHLLFIAALPLYWAARFDIATALAQNQAGVLENPLAAHSLDSMSATRERPIFSPSRRPPPPPPQPIVLFPSAPPPIVPPGLTLFGVVMEADEALAVVRVAPRNDIVRIRIGEEISGWKVTQIERRKLVLSLGDRSATFALFGGQATTAPIGRPGMRPITRQIPIQLQPPSPAAPR
jgi:hypothetical protein